MHMHATKLSKTLSLVDSVQRDRERARKGGGKRQIDNQLAMDTRESIVEEHQAMVLERAYKEQIVNDVQRREAQLKMLNEKMLIMSNDAYAGVKGEMEERKQARKELAASMEGRPRSGAKERLRRLRAVAGGKFHRFKARVKSLRKRPERQPLTMEEVLAAG